MKHENDAMIEALQELKSACLKIENAVEGDEASDENMDDLDKILEGKLQKPETESAEGLNEGMETSEDDSEANAEGGEEDENAFDPSVVSSFFSNRSSGSRKPLKAMRMGMVEKVPVRETKIKVMKK